MIILVAVIGRYSKPIHPEKSLDQLKHILVLAKSGTRDSTITTKSKIQILQRPIASRLGPYAILQLVADYRSGQTTIQLMETYQLSKTSVLKLLRASGVEMRRQPLPTEQVKRAVDLYTNGSSLTALESVIGAPRESIRRALIDAGIQLRGRGGSKPKSSPALRL